MPRNKVRDVRTINPFRPHVISPSDAVELQRMVNSRGWQVALDLMEAAVIEQDTALINAPVEDEAKVLGQHKVAKAAWMFFVDVQKKMQIEINKSLQLELEAAADPLPPKREADIT